jgi:hypothetical protein
VRIPLRLLAGYCAVPRHIFDPCAGADSRADCRSRCTALTVKAAPLLTYFAHGYVYILQTRSTSNDLHPRAAALSTYFVLLHPADLVCVITPCRRARAGGQPGAAGRRQRAHPAGAGAGRGRPRAAGGGAAAGLRASGGGSGSGGSTRSPSQRVRRAARGLSADRWQLRQRTAAIAEAQRRLRCGGWCRAGSRVRTARPRISSRPQSPSGGGEAREAAQADAALLSRPAVLQNALLQWRGHAAHGASEAACFFDAGTTPPLAMAAEAAPVPQGLAQSLASSTGV